MLLHRQPVKRCDCNREADFHTWYLIEVDSYFNFYLSGINPHLFVEGVDFFRNCSMILLSFLFLIDAPLNSTSVFAMSFAEPLDETIHFFASICKSLRVALFLSVFFLSEVRLQVPCAILLGDRKE